MADDIQTVEYHDLKTGEIWCFAGDEPLAAYIPAAPQEKDQE